MWLPGHDENGGGIIVAKVSAATLEGLDAALEKWAGYAVTRYEELELPLEE